MDQRAMMEATARSIGLDSDGGEEAPVVMLEALLDLSAAVLQKAQAPATAMASEDMLAAAESLEKVSRRIRELASALRPPEVFENGHAARILLADDLDLNRKLIADMLSLDGHDVDCVADGAAAVRAVEIQTYDLVLMDMVMPGMDGLAATRAIRALPGPAREVPIVALTAHSFREQLDNCLDAGMNATLTKPMSFDALSEAVNTWARSRQQAA